MNTLLIGVKLNQIDSTSFCSLITAYIRTPTEHSVLKIIFFYCMPYGHQNASVPEQNILYSKWNIFCFVPSGSGHQTVSVSKQNILYFFITKSFRRVYSIALLVCYEEDCRSNKFYLSKFFNNKFILPKALTKGKRSSCTNSRDTVTEEEAEKISVSKKF